MGRPHSRFAIGALATAISVAGSACDGSGAPSERLTDQVGLIPSDERPRYESHLAWLHDETGIDCRFLFVQDVGTETLEQFAVRKARALGVGRESDRRGVLFVYDLRDKRLRIEVGPQLEGVLTDAFVGYLMRDHARYFFESGDANLGLRLTLFILEARIREAALGDDYDPRPVKFIEDSRRLAHGAGATGAMADSEGAGGFLGTPADSAARAHYTPQPTVAATYQRYLEWLARQAYQTDLALFTPATRPYLARLPMTKGYSEYILYLEYGRRFEVDTRGDLALMLFTTSPLVSPHFFRRTAAGWQMDIWAEVHDTRNYVGGAYTWGFVSRGDDFSRTFADRLVPIGGVLRIAGGDNRALPIHKPKKG